MIKVAVIEDHQIFIDALNHMFSTIDTIECIGAVTTFAEGCALLSDIKADVLILNDCLPDGDGLDLIPIVHEKSPKTQILILTNFADEDMLLRAIDYGVNGFLTKSCSLTDLLTAIRKLSRGEVVMPSDMLVELLKRFPREQTVANSKENGKEKNLTPREYEVLSYLAKGKSGDVIAEELNIAPLTVRTHIRNMMTKLGAHSRLEAVSYAISNGLIELNM